jgi:hypothetical protein
VILTCVLKNLILKRRKSFRARHRCDTAKDKDFSTLLESVESGNMRANEFITESKQPPKRYKESTRGLHKFRYKR